MRKNRTQFHKNLLTLINEHDRYGGIMGLCREAGIPYQTMQMRLREPRAMRMYEFDNIVLQLGLDEEETAKLLTAIRNG